MGALRSRGYRLDVPAVNAQFIGMAVFGPSWTERGVGHRTCKLKRGSVARTWGGSRHLILDALVMFACDAGLR